MKPIYKPAGRALEYSPDALALNIYTGCPHRCYYCFAPNALRKDRETFHSHVEPRKGIVDAVKRQLEKGYVDYTHYPANPDDPAQGIKQPEKRRIRLGGKLIHLCFACDPYPIGYDTSVTREIIELIKDSGNHVQILTKGGEAAERDFDLLDENDWFGVSYAGYTAMQFFGNNDIESGAASPHERLSALVGAGINTWVSCEPVQKAQEIYRLITAADYIDLYRIGKLNYHPSDIDWGAFGRECERLCKEYGRNYYIKNDLRKEMEKSTK